MWILEFYGSTPNNLLLKKPTAILLQDPNVFFWCWLNELQGNAGPLTNWLADRFKLSQASIAMVLMCQRITLKFVNCLLGVHVAEIIATQFKLSNNRAKPSSKFMEQANNIPPWKSLALLLLLQLLAQSLKYSCASPGRAIFVSWRLSMPCYWQIKHLPVDRWLRTSYK